MPLAIRSEWFASVSYVAPADVRSEHDVVERTKRVIGGQSLAGEVVEAGKPERTVTQRVDERVGVVQGRARGIEVHGSFAHARELRCADHAGGLGCDHRVHGDDVRFLEQLLERMGRVLGVRVVGDDVHAETLEAPLHRVPHCAEADDARGLARVLPGAVALIGDRAAAVRVAGSHVAIGGHEPPGRGEEERNCDLRHRVGVAARSAQHRDPRRGGGGHVDVVGIAPARPDGEEGEIEAQARTRSRTPRRGGRRPRLRSWRPTARRRRAASAAARSTDRARRRRDPPGCPVPRRGRVP